MLLVATIAMAATAAFGPSVPAASANTSISNTQVNVACDNKGHTLNVLAQSSQMTDGHWNQGQYVMWEIFTRDLTLNSGWALATSWSPWTFVNGYSYVPANYFQDAQQFWVPQTLGQQRLQGQAGHNYQVMARFGYWTGGGYRWVNATTDAYIWMTAYGPLNPTSCAL